MTVADDCFAFPERRLLHEEAIGLLRALVAPAPEKESVSVFAAELSPIFGDGLMGQAAANLA